MNDIDGTATLCRNPDLVAADIDGDVVMLDVERGEYFGIGGIGPRIWELLDQPTTMAGIVDTICAEYDVDAGTCRADVERFLGELRQADLVRVS